MYVAEVPNRNSPPAILLCESFRENGKVRNRTIPNLSHWPPARIAALRSVLKGESPAASPAGSFDIITCPTPSQQRALEILGVKL